MEPTDPQVACFEAGVKFGALYHQFAGTPVSPETADSLETAIEEAISNQPHCTRVAVDIDADALADAITHGYTELTGQFMEVAVSVEYEGCEVDTRMEMVDGYPLMRVVDVREP